MSPAVGVLCAVRGGAEAPLVRALGGGRRLEVTRRCADIAELLAAAAAGLGRVAVVSAGLPGLDRAATDHLHGSGVVVVALVDVGWSAERIGLLGVDAVVPADAEVAAVVDEVQRVIAAAGSGVAPGRPPGGGRAVRGSPAERPAGAARERDGRPRPSAGAARRRHVDPPGAPGVEGGRIVSVWGPTGAPGRTTVALTLAMELAELARHDGGAATLVVDADTYGGTIAQLLGLLDEAPGIAAAARAAATGRLDVAGLAALTPTLANGLRVLTGMSRASRWPELPAAHLDVVWSTARELASWTVVDCGFSLEQDEALSYDTRAPQRNAATLSALEAADQVIVVGRGDPVGLQRLVRALGDLDDLGIASERRRVVVNRVRASASGPRPRHVVRDALRRYAGVVDVHVIPEDQAGCDGAVLNARTLTEHAPASSARRALAELAREVLSFQAPTGAH